jgi:hypothetical protein
MEGFLEMKKWTVLLAMCALAGTASALFENAYQGVVDSVSATVDENFRQAIVLIAAYITSNPSLGDWPTLTAIHDGFSWVAGFFTVALTFQGVKYVMAADSPGGRANAKATVQRLIAGMAVVAVNGHIFALGLDLSKALTDAVISDAAYSTGSASLALITASVGVACLVSPVAVLGVLALLMALASRYMLLLILWALFPMILAFYFSQFGFLTRLGGRGLNLFIAAVLSNPVMALIFKVSLDMFNAAADPATASLNVADKFLAFLLALAGFALAGLSPIMMLGLLDRVGAIVGAAATGVGSIAGGAAAGAAAGGLVTTASNGVRDAASSIGGQNPGTARNTLREAGEKAEEEMRKAAVKVASSADFKATDEGRMRFMGAVLDEYGSLRGNGVVKEDVEGRIQVGDAGKELGRQSGLLGGYEEWTAPYGRGFGDRTSREMAQSRGLMSDGKIVMKNAVAGSYGSGGERFEIAVNDGGDAYNVAVNGPKSMTVLTVAKSGGLDTREDVIRRISELSAQANTTPDRTLKRMHEGTS